MICVDNQVDIVCEGFDVRGICGTWVVGVRYYWALKETICK